jgi:hypothetical protein
MIKFISLFLAILLAVFSTAWGNTDDPASEDIESKMNKIVDSFKIGDHEVEVTFYDPCYYVPALHPEFLELPDSKEQEKSDIWGDYLYHHAVYLFKVNLGGQDKIFNYYCVRGNPEITNSSRFYKVEIIKGINKEGFNPNSDDYADHVTKVVAATGFGGTLFENMEIFCNERGKEAIGNGIKFLKYYRRVTSYSEVKNYLTKVIKEDLGIESEQASEEQKE